MTNRTLPKEQPIDSTKLQKYVAKFKFQGQKVYILLIIIYI